MVHDDASVCEDRLGALHYWDLVQALHVLLVDPLDILFKDPVLLLSVTEALEDWPLRLGSSVPIHREIEA